MTTECTNPKHAHGGVGRQYLLGECIECIREQRDAAIARAEKAEGERDAARLMVDEEHKRGVDALMELGRLNKELEGTRIALNQYIDRNIANYTRAEALAKFKAYVQKRLDEMHVPTHPNGPHSEHGCRVGDRLDMIAKREQDAIGLVTVARRERDEWKKRAESMAAELRIICAITPDLDGEDEDGEHEEVKNCLATAQRVAGRALHYDERQVDRTVPLVGGGETTLPVESKREVMDCPACSPDIGCNRPELVTAGTLAKQCHGCERCVGWLSVQERGATGTCPICKRKFISYGKGDVAAKVTT